MCNDVCICPGATGDKWYDDYKAVETAKLTSYGRTWDLLPTDNLKSLYFVEGIAERESHAIDTVKECIESTEELMNKLADFKVAEAEAASANMTPEELE